MPTDDLPRAVRILPSRFALRAGLAAGLILCSGLVLHGVPPAGRDPGLALIGYWAGLVAGAGAAIGCAVRLVLQLPVIEASELGIAVWLEGPYRRPFFAPWSHVRSIVLTRVRPGGAAACDALGIELDQDDRVRLPPAASGRPAPEAGAAPADLAWPARSIHGDPHRWVEVLERMKAAYGGP